jgi:hypothetical protein
MGKYIVVVDGKVYSEEVVGSFDNAKELVDEVMEEGNDMDSVEVFALGQKYEVVSGKPLLKKVD